MPRLILLILALTITPLPLLAQAPPPTTAPSPKEIDQSIDKAVKFILKNQRSNGVIGRVTAEAGERDIAADQQDAGRTALAVMALLAAGESNQSPAIQKAAAYLRTANLRTTYAIALRACAFSLMDASTRKNDLPKDLKWLLDAPYAQGDYLGLYSYFTAKESSIADLSNSQYGVLGAWYASEAGLDVPPLYWKRVDAGWRKIQNRDGGWSYNANVAGPSYTTMTCGGIATLFITSDYINWQIAQNLNLTVRNEPLDKAMKWLSDNFAVDHNEGKDPPRDQHAGTVAAWQHYMLFAYERVGEASGYTRFGNHPWYAEGAKYLLTTQNPDGSWLSSIGFTEDTSYALLFLARGRSPVAIQKLQYPGRWNNRPRDVSNVNRWLRRQTERHLNWQIVSIDSTPDELREAPILYLSGNSPVVFSPEQKQKLKQYIEEGGLIFAVNEGLNDNFTQSIATLAGAIFPNYKFRDLPKDHLLLRAMYPLQNFPFPIQGLSNGIRELIVLLPKGDFSWQWQSLPPGKAAPTPAASLFGNVYFYATDKSTPPRKGESHWIDRDPAIASARTVEIARLKHAGNWDPEPAAFLRFANYLANNDKLDLKVTSIAFDANPINRTCALAHLTTTAPLILTGPQLTALKTYIDGGGVLLFDAAGGAPDVATGFERQLQTLYPSALIDLLPVDHPIYSAGNNLTKVLFRRYAASTHSTGLTPRLRCLMLKDRLLAIISPEDLTAGLVGYEIDGINGYAPTSAQDILRNIVLWKLRGKP